MDFDFFGTTSTTSDKLSANFSSSRDNGLFGEATTNGWPMFTDSLTSSSSFDRCAANQIPSPIKLLVEAMRRGDLDEARTINRRYRKLLKLNFIESNPVPVKYALARMGMIEENYRLPLVPLSEENKQIIDQELKTLGLI